MLQRGPPAPPPPLRSSFPWWRRDHVCSLPWEVAEPVSMSSSRLDGQCWRCGASGPSPPPPRALGAPLALLSRSIAANTAWMARALRLVAAVAKEEWQWRR